MFVVILLLLLILLAIVALRWGYDSRDGFKSKEWGKRSQRGLSW